MTELAPSLFIPILTVDLSKTNVEDSLAWHFLEDEDPVTAISSLFGEKFFNETKDWEEKLWFSVVKYRCPYIGFFLVHNLDFQMSNYKFYVL